ncbi:MAG: arylamine N-acetyltransferase family protein [Vicinamibacterales bacterium]
MTLFNSSAFDLRAYLYRIGVDHRPARADLATLQELALLHPCAIPFENLDPLLRRPVRLDIAAIQDKLVRGGRGGWCFEHNLLLGTALAAIGYEVTGLSARVVWNVAPGVVRGRSHMVLHVTLDGVSYIVDVGFGGSTPTAPLKLVEGLEQTTPHEPFRLMPVSRGCLLEAKLEGTWKGLYSFDQQPQVLGDYEIPNWYLCNHPESHFLDRVVAARVDRDRRYALRNTDFAVHFPHGVTERRVLGGAGEIRQVLTETFRINVPDWPEVDETFERLARSSPATT